MNRRELLTATGVLLASGSVAGCSSVLSESDDDSDGAPTPEQDDSNQSDDDTTDTPEQLPDDCSSLPDIEGLPTPPEERTQDTVTEFVRAFEEVYAVATKSRYSALESIQTDVEAVPGGYKADLAVEAERPRRTPGPDGSTPTPEPSEAYAHRATYRLNDDTLVRILRGFPGGRELSRECWILDSAQ
jgi:hypothetical protein